MRWGTDNSVELHITGAADEVESVTSRLTAELASSGVTAGNAAELSPDVLDRWGRSRRAWAFAIGRAFRPPLSALLDCAQDYSGADPDDDQIDDHLSGDDQPRCFGLGGDVAEPDRGEHGDGEVQRVGVCQLLAEAPGGLGGYDEIGAGEQQEEQREAGGQGLDRSRNRDTRIERTWKVISAMSATSPVTSIVTAAPGEVRSRGSR